MAALPVPPTWQTEATSVWWARADSVVAVCGGGVGGVSGALSSHLCTHPSLYVDEFLAALLLYIAYLLTAD